MELYSGHAKLTLNLQQIRTLPLRFYIPYFLHVFALKLNYRTACWGWDGRLQFDLIEIRELHRNNREAEGMCWYLAWVLDKQGIFVTKLSISLGYCYKLIIIKQPINIKRFIFLITYLISLVFQVRQELCNCWMIEVKWFEGLFMTGLPPKFKIAYLNLVFRRKDYSFIFSTK